jgi:putative chitinase
LQITGRESYTRYGLLLKIPLVDKPMLANDPAYALEIACAEWVGLGCNAAADADNVVDVTRKINGGLTGLNERREWLTKTRAVWPSKEVVDV